MPTLLITGANRGLGLEFVRQYAADGWRVFATCREPSKADALQELAEGYPGTIRIYPLDVRDLAAGNALAEELRDEPIDLLLNNAGVAGPRGMSFGTTDYAAWAEVFAVNVLAPARLTETFVEHIARSRRRLVAMISSKLGSIALNTEGRRHLYRSTKAALNMTARSFAAELRGRGICVVTLHPGWVRTDMGGAEADLAPEESIRGIRNVLDRVTLEDSGKFINWDGQELPW